MIPIRITLSGFMSYEAPQTLDFSGDSLWILVGKNASGKSTVFDAMTYALFGEARTVGVNNSRLVNHKSDRAEIEFDFMVGSSLYRVRRTIDSAGHTTRQAILLVPQIGDKPKELAVPGTDKAMEFKRWVENEVGLNLDVFTTAMMLRQGKADALLDADTESRYSVLSKLIDLSRYEALAEKSKALKNHWSERAAGYRENLQRIQAVTEEDLAGAKRLICDETAFTEQAHEQVRELTSLFGYSQKWEVLSGTLEASKKSKEELQKLLGQEGEITHGYHRLGELRIVLPSLRSIGDIHQRIASTQKAIERLEQDDINCAEPLLAAEALRDALSGVVGDLEQQVETLTAAGRQASERLADLDATVKVLDQIDQDGRLVARYRQDLDAFPTNLDELVSNARAECERLTEASSAQTNLTRLVNERNELSKSNGNSQRTEQKLADLIEKQPGLERDKQAAVEESTRADEAVSTSREAYSQAKARQAEATERQKRFDEVVGEAKCRYCGQEMSEEHKVAEKVELDNDLQKWNIQVQKAQKLYNETLTAQKTAGDRLKAAHTALTALEMILRDTRRDLALAEEDIKSKQRAVTLTYQALSASFRARVASTEPGSLAGWLDTQYPTPQDLKQITDEVKGLAEKKKSVATLENQQSSRQTTQTLWEERRKELEGARSRLPDGWEQSRGQQAVVAAEKVRADRDATVAQNKLKQARIDRDKAAGEANRLIQEQVARRATLIANRTNLQKGQEALQSQLALIPAVWLEEAAGITSTRCDDLQTEQNSLSIYERRHQELLACHQNLAEVNKRIAADEASIAELPVEARQAAANVGQTLKAAQTASGDADLRLQAAMKILEQKEIQKAQFAEMEQLWKEADRKAHLYGILTEQLGERGIQRMLVCRAEQGIVRHANQLLDNLSGGRSQLRLREEGGNRKALDLEVTDAVTGAGKPLLVGLASGSQRFRIAISLALAIGRYIGHESHHIESVVIDEGFGSLDNDGRESVVQELHNLRQHLKRIILVSHQEEFSKGFTTGYRIQIEDGASRVRLLDQ